MTDGKHTGKTFKEILTADPSYCKHVMRLVAEERTNKSSMLGFAKFLENQVLPHPSVEDVSGLISIPETLRAQRLKKFKILKFSSEIENFKRAVHQTSIYCGEF